MKEFVIFDEKQGKPFGKKLSKEFIQSYRKACGCLTDFFEEHDDELSELELRLIGGYISSIELDTVINHLISSRRA